MGSSGQIGPDGVFVSGEVIDRWQREQAEFEARQRAKIAQASDIPPVPVELVASNSRPSGRGQVATVAGADAVSALVAVEAELAQQIRAAEAAHKDAVTDVRLSAQGRVDSFTAAARRIGVAMSGIAGRVDAIAQHWRNASAGIVRAVEQRERNRTAAEATLLVAVQDAIGSLSDEQRNRCLIAAIQGSDARVLEAVSIYPATLDATDGAQLSGSILGVSDRAAVQRAYRASLAGPLVAEERELRAISEAVAFECSLACGIVEKRLGAPLDSEPLSVRRAVWQRDGLDCYTDADLHAARFAAEKRGEDARAYLAGRAAELVVEDV